METLTDLAWRIYPAAAIVAFGGAGAGVGVRRIVRSIRDRGRVTGATAAYVTGLRLVFVGLAAAGVGVAWIW